MKDVVYFDEDKAPRDNEKGAAYRELRNWKAAYLAALGGGHPDPTYAAGEFVRDFDAKRAELLN